MRLVKLTMENFGPYLGKHELDLMVTPNAPVILVHGENMRGKTSILNAIRWCLYETARDRRGRTRPSSSFMSYDALDAGQLYMAVVLEFEHDGSSYRLERHASATQRPTSDQMLTLTVSLRRDGHFLPTEDIPEHVADILHPDIARFFLFDGEMLAQYEILLTDAGRDSDVVKDSIERILGLPAIQLIQKDLEELRRDAGNRQLQAMKAEKKHEDLVAKTQQAQAELDGVNSDIKQLEELANAIEAERGTLASQLMQYAEVQADIREADTLEDRIRQVKQEQEDALTRTKQLLSQSWWTPLLPVVTVRLAELRKQLSNATQDLDQDASLRQAQLLIRQSIVESRCQICDREVNGQLNIRLQSRLEELERDIGKLRGRGSSIVGTFAEEEALRDLADSAKVAQLEDAEKSVRKSRLGLRKLEEQADAVRARLRGHPRSEIGTIERRLEEAIRRGDDLRKDMDLRAVARDEKLRRLQDLQREIQKLPDADPRTATEAGIYNGLSTLFEAALTEFRIQVRQEVEREASNIFRQLTTEPNYGGLKINDRYGLEIVDKNNRVIGERSAGAEQIVALSLVGALNRCATREGPVVMDTPFGRLDVGHRERVLKFLPTLSAQVILLVQSGELDVDRDLKHLAGYVGRELTLVRDTHTTSHIEKYQAV